MHLFITAVFRTRLSAAKVGRDDAVEKQVEKRRQSQPVEQHGHDVQRRRKTGLLTGAVSVRRGGCAQSRGCFYDLIILIYLILPSHT